jgi:hypothetical protein
MNMMAEFVSLSDLFICLSATGTRLPPNPDRLRGALDRAANGGPEGEQTRSSGKASPELAESLSISQQGR